jgi:hypothetical protein
MYLVFESVEAVLQMLAIMNMDKKLFSGLFILIMLLGSAGCSTIMKGTDDNLAFSIDSLKLTKIAMNSISNKYGEAFAKKCRLQDIRVPGLRLSGKFPSRVNEDSVVVGYMVKVSKETVLDRSKGEWSSIKEAMYFVAVEISPSGKVVNIDKNSHVTSSTKYSKDRITI